MFYAKQCEAKCFHQRQRRPRYRTEGNAEMLRKPYQPNALGEPTVPAGHYNRADNNTALSATMAPQKHPQAGLGPKLEANGA